MTEADDYQRAIAPIRQHLADAYQPLFEQYLAAARAGDVIQMQSVAERLDEAADEAESLWTATLFDDATDGATAVFVNEAAGAMAMISDQWTALATAHQEHLDAHG